MKPQAGPPTFLAFIASLRALEAAGKIRVVKWPKSGRDTFRVRVVR